ncbi:PRD domain-containing protein [Erwinia mallotivora]|uniref:PRD domain-containing protein n=1 Tax=Erwinia mallotivora TaxID=69222 RepID=UPI0035E8731B
MIKLPAESLVNEIRKFNKAMIASLDIFQPINLLTGLIMHIACMVEKVKGGELISLLQNKSEYVRKYGEEINIIRKNIIHLENAFDVSLSENELCTIHRYYRQ